MPELPESIARAKEMHQELVGKTIAGIEVIQPKCLNISEEEFIDALTGAQIQKVTHRGKWMITQASTGWWLLCLGMGGEVLLVTRKTLPEKYRLILDFSDESCLAVNFWWFGYSHYVKNLDEHKMTSQLGPDAWKISLEEFQQLLNKRKGGIKSFLLNQKRIAGIGNVYIQDPLFIAGIHPLRRIDTLSESEIETLWKTLQDYLQDSIDLGGAMWEQNLYGDRGSWDASHFQVAYQEDKPCPKCGTTVEKIKTGSTSSYVCLACQPLT